MYFYLPSCYSFLSFHDWFRLVKYQIRQLEEEIESWHCMQELVVSDGTSDLQSIFSISEFDDQTYAILRGKQVRYCMRSKEVCIVLLLLLRFVLMLSLCLFIIRYHVHIIVLVN